jgi:hypothetical protein
MGLQGDRSGMIFKLARILSKLQQLAPPNKLGYILENVPAEFNYKCQMVRKDAALLDVMLGRHVVVDAVQHGSYAHRVRAIWTNVASTEQLQQALGKHKPPPCRKVDDILNEGRTAPVAQHSDRWPRCQVNVAGRPMRALPTVMAHPYSYAYRVGQPGQMINTDNSTSQPTVEEKERALGYATGATAAAGVTERQREELLGRCMDAWCMQAIWATIAALQRHQVTVALVGQQFIHGDESEPCTGLVQDSLHSGASNKDSLLGNMDVWEDHATMNYLQTGQLQGLPAKEKTRIRRRAALFQWRQIVDEGASGEGSSGKLIRIMPDLTTRIVPQPQSRLELVEEMHCRSGHFGMRRTMGLLACSHWWRGMRRTVNAVCRSCAHCGKANATFTSINKQLQPLPVMGLFYRWGVDLCGPFQASALGHKYIMIAIEHYSKHAEVIPITEAKSDTTARAFLQHVLSKFGACAEVVTDGGSEFKGRFTALLQDCYIDHRRTSAEHPQSNGLAERCVRTIKKCLNAVIDEKQSKAEWEQEVHWVALGYRASPQMSTGMSPFEMLYARKPTVPPAVQERMLEPIDFDDARKAAAELTQRAAWVRQAGVMVDSALATAQHRDTLRYAKIRSGAYVQRLHRYLPGDYVYVRKPGTQALGAANLQQLPQDKVLKVMEVRTGGVVRLIGRDAATMDVQITQLAPCHLLGIDGTIDATLQRPSKDMACRVCNHPDQEDRMILCDACGSGWHTHCLSPQLTSIPEGNWYCTGCKGTVQQHEGRHAQNIPVSAEELDGSWYMQTSTTKQGGVLSKYAKIRKVSALSTARPFELTFQDGTTTRVATRVALRGAMPTGFKPPQMKLCAVVNTAELLEVLDYSSEQAARSVLNTLMPGHWHTGYAHALMAAGGMNLDGPADTAEHVKVLLQSVDMSRYESFTVAGTELTRDLAEELERQCAHMDVHALTNTGLKWHLHPGPYKAARLADTMDVVIAAPSQHVTDVIVALSCMFAKHLACIFIPVTYLSHAPMARYQFLAALRSKNRMSIIMAEPVKPGRVQHVWLCVWSSAHDRARTCRTYSG